MELAQDETMTKLKPRLFGKQVFQALSSTCHLLQRCFIHTPENKVLMHQCAISAKDIKINSLSHPSIVFTPSSFSPVPGGQKPQKGTNGRCSTLVEESNGEQNNLLEYTVD